MAKTKQTARHSIPHVSGTIRILDSDEELEARETDEDTDGSDSDYDELDVNAVRKRTAIKTTKGSGARGTKSKLQVMVETSSDEEAAYAPAKSRGVPRVAQLVNTFGEPTSSQAAASRASGRSKAEDKLHENEFAFEYGIAANLVKALLKANPGETYDQIENRVQTLVMDKGEGSSSAKVAGSGDAAVQDMDKMVARLFSEPVISGKKAKLSNATAQRRAAPPAPIYAKPAHAVWANDLLKDLILEFVHRPGGEAKYDKTLARMLTLNKAIFDLVIMKLYKVGGRLGAVAGGSRGTDLYDYMSARKATSDRTVHYADKVKEYAFVGPTYEVGDVKPTQLSMMYRNLEIMSFKVEGSSHNEQHLGIELHKSIGSLKLDSADLVLLKPWNSKREKCPFYAHVDRLTSNCRFAAREQQAIVDRFRATMFGTNIPVTTFTAVRSGTTTEENLQVFLGPHEQPNPGFDFSQLEALRTEDVVWSRGDWLATVRRLKKLQEVSFTHGPSWTMVNIGWLAYNWRSLTKLVIMPDQTASWAGDLASLVATVRSNCPRIVSLACPVNSTMEARTDYEPDVFYLTPPEPKVPLLKQLKLFIIKASTAETTGLEINVSLLELVSRQCHVEIFGATGKAGVVDIADKMLARDVKKGREAILSSISAYEKAKAQTNNGRGRPGI